MRRFRKNEKYVEEDEIAGIAAREELSIEDVKRAIRGVRHTRGYDDRFDYANGIVPQASEYLRPHTLSALVQAEISDGEAAIEIEQNKLFFSRLVDLLPTLMRFLSKEARTRNPMGMISMIDDCHNDFHYTTRAARIDRQLREAKESLRAASKLASETAVALQEATRYFSFEYERYRDVYLRPTDEGPSRFLSDLIRELQMCSGVLEIVNATAAIQPKRLFLSGNDQRGSVVKWAYHICTMWDGPKLVTTPGSDFATFCSLLYEAVSGTSDEGLAGVINRYARSDDRKQWDQEGENEQERDNDNFMVEKNSMRSSVEQIELCTALLRNSNMSDMAKMLLRLRMEHETSSIEKALTTYGPRQVYISQLNEEQLANMIGDAVRKFKPEQLDQLGRSVAEKEIELGQARRKTGKSTPTSRTR
jgi:hypothetical protein